MNEDIDKMRVELAREAHIVTVGWISALEEYRASIEKIIKGLEA